MATNQIALITKFSTEAWDKVYMQEAVTSVLDANKDLVKFTGAKTVKIGKWMNGGLHNYYRNNSGDPRVNAPQGNFVGAAGFGYKSSAARLIWEEFTLKQDRGAAFEIEYFDNEESGGNLVGTGVAEISRTTIVPEVDAYALSTIAGYTNAQLENKVAKNIVLQNAGDNQDTPISALNKGILYLKKHQVELKDQIAFCSCDFMNALRETQEGGVVKPLLQSDLGKEKNTTFEITNYMGITLIEVEPNRLRTNIQLIDSDDGGYYWPTAADVAANSGTPFEGMAASEEINFLIVSKEAVTHVVKYEKIKIISGDLNLAGRGFDGYTIYARIYHDVFVPDNKRVGIYCNTTYTEVVAPEAKVSITLDEDNRIDSIVTIPGNKMYLVGTSTDTGADIGSTLTNFSLANVGDKVAAETTYFAIEYTSRKVVAKQTVKPIA